MLMHAHTHQGIMLTLCNIHVDAFDFHMLDLGSSNNQPAQACRQDSQQEYDAAGSSPVEEQIPP